MRRQKKLAHPGKALMSVLTDNSPPATSVQDKGFCCYGSDSPKGAGGAAAGRSGLETFTGKWEVFTRQRPERSPARLRDFATSNYPAEGCKLATILAVCSFKPCLYEKIYHTNR